MIKYSGLIFLLSITACSSLHKKSIFELADKTKYSVVKKTNALNVDEAKKILQSRFNYLTMLFEQSRDPYYGHPKWTDYCLQSNKIGPVTKTQNAIMSVSEIYVDGSGNPGFCPENPYALKAYEIAFYCENEQMVYQISLPSKDKLDLQKVSLCK